MSAGWRIEVHTSDDATPHAMLKTKPHSQWPFALKNHCFLQNQELQMKYTVPLGPIIICPLYTLSLQTLTLILMEGLPHYVLLQTK